MKIIGLYIFAIFALALIRDARATRECYGEAYYKITFKNFLYGENPRFTDLIPSDGLAFSPLAAASHSKRFSFFTTLGFASPEIEAIAETGDNSGFLELAEKEDRVLMGAGGAAALGNQTQSVVIKVNCAYPYATALSMIAPSPDWIVQVNNVPLVQHGYFVKERKGYLFAYDAGTDSGREFTPPSDTTLDIPTVPQDNIILLSRDETDRFNGKPVGFYYIRRVQKSYYLK